MANEVVVKVRADTRKAQRSLNDLKGSGDKLNAGLKRAMKGGAIALAGLATAAAASAIKMAIEFEAAMSEVRTLLPQASDEAFGALTADLTAFMKEMNVASSDAVPALYSALSAGVPQDNVIDFLRVASQAATGGVTDLETAVDGLSTVVNVYGADTIDATRASDLMFTVVRLGKTTFGELSATLSNVLPTAQAFGVSVEEVAAALATMTAKGVPTAQSTTQLRALFVETNKESRKLAQAIVELTGKSFRDLMTEGRSAAGVLQELRESVGEKEFSQLFRSVESMNAALLMTGPNAEKMTENLTAMQEAAGATETAFQVVADTTKFQLGQAWNELKVTLMDLGMKALPFIVDALDILKVVVANVSRVVKSDILPALRSFWAVLKDTGYLRFVITQFKNWWTQMKVTWGILKDFLRFVKAVFKGDWKAAWDAVKDIFRGFVNLIITQANRLINVMNAVAGIFKAI
ncbi:MAG TPA: phage tail tape measure protein, partial [Candidatus Latescibacteria bacterium]|nr:phage tail tape measure protein [Candidatus Latescibacterota bacterium]